MGTTGRLSRTGCTCQRGSTSAALACPTANGTCHLADSGRETPVYFAPVCLRQQCFTDRHGCVLGQNPKDPRSEQRLARRREWRRLAALKKARRWTDGGNHVSAPLELLPLDPERIPPLGPLADAGVRSPAAFYARQIPYAFVPPPSRHPLAGRRPPVALVRFPETFSFIDDPERALRAIEETLTACAQSPSGRVVLDQSRCRQVDYGAGSVLCALVIDAMRYGIRVSGRYPSDPSAWEIVASTGLPQELGVAGPPLPHFLPFGLRKGIRGMRAAAPSDRDRLATEFVEHLDECLSRYHVELDPDGKHHLSQLFTEAIGNAEDHGGQREWWIGGYLRQPPGNAPGDLNISVFNFGNTICQTLNKLPEGSLLRDRLSGLVERHRGDGSYGRTYSPEETWMLGAMQEGVSRVNDQADRLGHRGTGTFHMAETFQTLSRPADATYRPMMVVVSGRSRVVFDGRHRMVETDTGFGEVRPVIAFNDDNDLRLRPNPRNVHRLERVFPGTIISLRVYLDGDHLQSLASVQP